MKAYCVKILSLMFMLTCCVSLHAQYNCSYVTYSPIAPTSVTTSCAQSGGNNNGQGVPYQNTYQTTFSCVTSMGAAQGAGVITSTSTATFNASGACGPNTMMQSNVNCAPTLLDSGVGYATGPGSQNYVYAVFQNEAYRASSPLTGFCETTNQQTSYGYCKATVCACSSSRLMTDPDKLVPNNPIEADMAVWESQFGSVRAGLADELITSFAPFSLESLWKLLEPAEVTSAQ